MVGNGIPVHDDAAPYETRSTTGTPPRLRLLIVMGQGSAGELREAWRSFARIEDARARALEALRNSEVLRVAIVQDGCGLVGAANPLRFVEWVGRCHIAT